MLELGRSEESFLGGCGLPWDRNYVRNFDVSQSTGGDVFLLTSSRKKDTKDIIGTAGTKSVLEGLHALDPERRTATVAIGGINVSNVQRVMFKSKAPRRGLDGVAVIRQVAEIDAEANAQSF